MIIYFPTIYLLKLHKLGMSLYWCPQLSPIITGLSLASPLFIFNFFL